MVELSMGHVLILVIVVFMLYHFMGRRYSCNGFSIGNDVCNDNKYFQYILKYHNAFQINLSECISTCSNYIKRTDIDNCNKICHKCSW